MKFPIDKPAFNKALFPSRWDGNNKFRRWKEQRGARKGARAIVRAELPSRKYGWNTPLTNIQRLSRCIVTRCVRHPKLNDNNNKLIREKERRKKYKISCSMISKESKKRKKRYFLLRGGFFKGWINRLFDLKPYRLLVHTFPYRNAKIVRKRADKVGNNITAVTFPV